MLPQLSNEEMPSERLPPFLRIYACNVAIPGEGPLSEAKSSHDTSSTTSTR